MPDGHERAEERNERRQRDWDPLPARLGDVTELVYEDQQDEAEPELPAPEPERVGGEGDEEGEELPEQEAPLERRPADHDGRADEPLERAPDDAAVLLDLRAHDPRPIQSSPPA
jgi:hypothetical protein